MLYISIITMMDDHQRNKLVAILLLSAISIPLLLFGERIGAFVPVIGAFVNETVITGELSTQAKSTTPGFYVFGATVSLLTGFSGMELIYLPITLLGVTTVFYVIARDFSRSPLFASAVTLMFMVSGTAGGKVLFQVHGFGMVLFLVTVFLSLKTLSTTSDMTIPLGLTAVSAVFISYNMTFWVVSILVGLIALLKGVQVLDKTSLSTENAHYVRNQFGIVAASTLIVILSISEFVYDTFIPMMIQTTLFGSFGSSGVDPALAPLILETPPSITYLGILKYIPLGLSGILMTVLTIWRIQNHEPLDPEELVLYAVAFVSVFYALMRTLIGHDALTAFFYPGVFAFLLLYQYMNNIEWAHQYTRPLSVCFLSILLITSGLTFYVYVDSGLSTSEKGNEEVEEFAVWHKSYSDRIVMTDVRSRSLSTAYLTENRDRNNQSVADLFYGQYRTIRLEDIHYLINGEDPPNSDNRLYLVNTRYPSITLGGWRHLTPWTSHLDNIDSNQNSHKVYESGDTIAYLSH